MIELNQKLSPNDLDSKISRLFELALAKITQIDQSSNLAGKTPVFTVDGKYVAQGWTEWTQGFQFGAALLCFDVTDDPGQLRIGRQNTLEKMAPHVTSFGVHDHGFNNVSTYGALRRLMKNGRIPHEQGELAMCELALKSSGAVQAARWSETDEEQGYIYSFNGPHSLFCDTIRSLRSLALAHHLGHFMLEENDERVSLLDRLIEHAATTAEYNVYFGEDRDVYDVRGRVAHESIFNTNDGCYRCPNTHQGFSPFTTWTRGLAWVMLGYPELLEFLQTVDEKEFEPWGSRGVVEEMMLNAARATCDFYIDNTPRDGVPYWDTGAPGLVKLGDYLDRPSDPYNDHEPVDSSAAAIAAQGLLRLGAILQPRDEVASSRYFQAGLKVMSTLLNEPFLSTSPDHEGMLLHSVYHRPKGWDHIPEGAKTPRGESSMWGDYHLLEAALYVKRLTDGPYYTFWGED